MIYAKIWRWPDLHKNELKQAEFCQYGFDHKDKDLVCVNPYHYNRVIGPGLDLSGLTLGLAAAAAASHGQMPPNWGPFVRSPGMGGWPNGAPVKAGTNGNGTAPGAAHHFPAVHHYPGGGGFNRPPGAAAAAAAAALNGAAKTNGNHHAAAEMKREQPSPAALPANGSANRNSWHQPLGVPQTAGNGQNGNEDKMKNGSPESAASVPHVNGGSNGRIASAPPAVAPGPISRQPMPDMWCSIDYFELDSQVGETFKVPAACKSVIVDGFTSVNGSTSNGHGGIQKRFCLGALTNVHRTEASEKTLKHIGKGIQIELVGEGDVWVQCLSPRAIFVQSYFLDRQAGRSPGDAVTHKLHQGSTLQV